MADKKVYLVTGASGFIGSLLTRRLIANGEDVHIIIRKGSAVWRIQDLLGKVKSHVSDLSDTERLSKIINDVSPSVIYHLAAYGAYPYQSEPDKIIQTNILGTWNLLKAAARVDYELFVNTGSSSEYGFKNEPMKETDLLEPASYYAVTKSSQSLLCMHIAREEKRPIVALRPFSVYGPYEEPTRFIPTLMRALYLGEKMDLVSPEIARDLIYVEDMVDAFLCVDRLKKCAGEIFNVGTGVQSSIRAVVEAAVKVTGKTTDFRWGNMEPRMWDTNKWVADISKSASALAWSPKTGLEKGLLLTWEWFRAHGISQDRMRHL